MFTPDSALECPQFVQGLEDALEVLGIDQTLERRWRLGRGLRSQGFAVPRPEPSPPPINREVDRRAKGVGSILLDSRAVAAFVAGNQVGAGLPSNSTFLEPNAR